MVLQTASPNLTMNQIQMLHESHDSDGMSFFKFDFAKQDDQWKVQLLLGKLGPAELDKYCNPIKIDLLPISCNLRSYIHITCTLIDSPEST